MPQDASPTPPPADFLSRVSRAQRSLYAFILTLVRQPADADDVLQETNLVLWRKAHEYDPTRDFMPWALRIAQLQSLAHLKREKRVPMTFAEPLLAVLADEAIQKREELDLRRHALTGCLQKLPERQRFPAAYSGSAPEKRASAHAKDVLSGSGTGSLRPTS